MAKILLVEDNEANREMLGRRLRSRGHEVVCAADGEAAVAMASSESPDVILMDLNLPALDGWSATRRIKAAPATRGIPVIALTAHAMPEDRERATAAGCDEFETKPLDLFRLLDKITMQLSANGRGAAPAGSAPAAPQPAAAAAAAVAAAVTVAADDRAPHAHEGRVLVVDDVEDNRVVLARRLARAGYSVETAEDGAAALRRLRAEPFDLVILDVMMPGLDGFEVLDEIRRARPATELPVIMATARDASEEIVKAFDHGANDYVTKPLDFGVVLARVQTHVDLKRSIDQVRALERDLAARNAELLAANARMTADLDAASRVQAALLPAAGPAVPGYAFAWLFQPSAGLAGDIFNVFRLDDRHVGLYVLDVSGHGVAAALLSVTVSRFLFPVPDPTSLLWERDPGGTEIRLAPPARVAERLGERFPFDTATGQYFTLVYGVLDLHAHRFRYVSAGHPLIVRCPRGGPSTLVEADGYPIGVGPPGEYDEVVVDLAPGDRLYVYSDGIPEAMNPEGDLFGCARMLEMLCSGAAATVDDGLARLSDALMRWSAPQQCQDDQTALCLERLN